MVLSAGELVCYTCVMFGLATGHLLVIYKGPCSRRKIQIINFWINCAAWAVIVEAQALTINICSIFKPLFGLISTFKLRQIL